MRFFCVSRLNHVLFHRTIGIFISIFDFFSSISSVVYNFISQIAGKTRLTLKPSVESKKKLKSVENHHTVRKVQNSRAFSFNHIYTLCKSIRTPHCNYSTRKWRACPFFRHENAMNVIYIFYNNYGTKNSSTKTKYFYCTTYLGFYNRTPAVIIFIAFEFMHSDEWRFQ